MPFFIALHKWKKKDFVKVGKKVIEALSQLPEGVSLCSSYCDAEQTGAWCIYEAESGDAIQKFLMDKVPEMSTDVKPVIQFFPPSPDLYQMLHIVMSM